jgi:carbon starvation protein
MGKIRYAWVTLVPMIWLVLATQTAGYQKMFHPDPRIGFLAEAERLDGLIQAGSITGADIASTRRLIFNNQLDAVVTGLFAVMVLVIVLDSAKEWLAILSRRKVPILHEAEYVVSTMTERRREGG